MSCQFLLAVNAPHTSLATKATHIVALGKHSEVSSMVIASGTATELAHQIFDLQRVLRCIVTANIAKDTDIGFALQGVMRFIGEREWRATKLAARLGVGPPVLSRHIAELAELGLVVRRPDPADGRAQLVALSERGFEKVRLFEEQHSLNLRAYLEGWSEEDALTAGKVLEKLTESLNHSVRATAASSPPLEPQSLGQQQWQPDYKNVRRVIGTIRADDGPPDHGGHDRAPDD